MSNTDLVNLPHDGQRYQSPTNPSHSIQYIREYVPAGVIRRIGGGSSCHVGILKDNTVIKYPLVKGENMSSLTIEYQILTALGKHKRIIRCLGLTEDGLKLEFAKGGSISSYMERTHASAIPVDLRLKWSQQAAEAVAFIHSRGVIHCDIHTNNLLLDDNLDVKLSDFQGTYKDLDGYAMESTRFCLPREPTTTPNVTTDLFALGSSIYTIMTGFEPYLDLLDTEVEERYKKRQFPTVDGVIGGEVIQKCWVEAYVSATELLEDLVGLDIRSP
jgi:serine/threonine protein kinase